MTLQPIISQGAITAILAPEISDADARWLFNVLVNHWFDDVFPDNVPQHLVLVTRLVVSEQDVIKNGIQERHERRVSAGRMGGFAKANSNAKQNVANVAMLSNSSNAKNAKHKTKENKKKLNNPEKEINKEKAPLLTEGSVSESVINLSSNSVSVYFATDPVGYAMKLIQKQDERNYRTLVKYFNGLGTHTFCDVVNEFESELHQGEMKNVRNLAALLISKLKKEPTI